MLGKLIRYDFLAISRILLPIYIALLVISVLIGVQMRMDPSQFFAGFLYAAYECVIIAGVITTAYLVIERFYHNLLGNEGYLMFALPVSTAQHIIAKILTAVIWVFLGCAVVLLSMVITVLIAVPFSNLSEMFQNLQDFLSHGNLYGESIISVIETVVAGMILLVSFITKIYASIAVGHLWNSHRTLGGLLSFILISILEVWLTQRFMMLVPEADLLITDGAMLIWTALLGLLTWYILDRHLNLE